MSLTLVGSIHSDFDEIPRLREVLAEEQPNIIFLEGSEVWGRVNERIDRQIAKRLKRANLDKSVKNWHINYYKNWRFEHREARSYASTNKGTRIEYLEPDPIMPPTQKLETWVQKTIDETIDKIIQGGQSGVDEARQQAGLRIPHMRSVIERVLEDPNYEFNELEPIGDVAGLRDRVMSDTLLRKVEQHLDQHILVITGLGHIVGNVRRASMYSLICHLEPKRVFLPLEK